MHSLFRYILLLSIMLFGSLRVAGQHAMPDNVCTGAVKHYYVDPNPVPGSTYTWKIDGVIQLGSATNEIDISWNTPGTYLLEVQELSVDGCYGPLRSGQVFVSPLPAIIVSLTVQPTCTVPAGSVVLSGLPTGNWIINPGSISGSGSSTTISNLGSGTYNFTVTDAAGCTSEATADVIINAQPETPAAPSVSNSAPVNVCPVETIDLTTLVTSITPPGGSILYKTTNDPLGIAISDPTAVGTGIYYIFYQTQEGCYSSGTIITTTINECFKTLNIIVYLEGLYNGVSGLVKVQDSYDGMNSYDMFTGTVSDTLTIQLAQVISPYQTVYTAHGVPINTDGTINLNVIPATLSGDYFIIIKHRNHIETWSQSISFEFPIINYNFTTAISKAWGNNMMLIGTKYCIYTGDTNNDQFVDGFDLAIVFNLNKQGGFGYRIADINGDGFIDGFDLAKVFNNNKKGVGINTPTNPM
jgi:hypothetical protein